MLKLTPSLHHSHPHFESECGTFSRVLLTSVCKLLFLMFRLFPQSKVSERVCLPLFGLLSLNSCGLAVEPGDVKIAPRNFVARPHCDCAKFTHPPVDDRPTIPYHHITHQPVTVRVYQKESRLTVELLLLFLSYC